MISFLESFFGRFAHDLGIDLGTANTLVYTKEKGIVINEPSVVAVNIRTDQILAVGQEAYRMVGRTPAHIVANKPLVDGVISDFEVSEKMLKYFFRKVNKETFLFSPRPRVVIGIPLDVTEVERKAVEDAVHSAGGREVYLIEQPMAAAIGARLPVQDSRGWLVVDIGGGTTDIAVISLGGIVTSRSLKIAGNELNDDIIKFSRDYFNVLLGERTGEHIKIKIGTAEHPTEPLYMKVRGRDLLTGLPKEIIIDSLQIRDALSKSVRTIVDSIRSTIESTPPELVADIAENGILLTGGGALLKGLDRLIAEATGIPVIIAEDPLTCVVRGTAILLDDIDLLKRVASMEPQQRYPL
ncbi:rod shape-determining protein [Candidatus Uhrbacteria bacterium]|nr:rod shape-determining protein [Candidatus Uhrbacteria bacterium]